MRRAPGGRATTISARDYRTLAELRYQLRRFLRAREEAARAIGLEPQQYVTLLQIKGLPPGRTATVSYLAERLQIRHHAAVQLVDRLVARGMVERRRDTQDRREVSVCLRPAGEQVLRRLARYSLDELTQEGPELLATLRALMLDADRARSAPRRARARAAAGR
jgi:DNA-binding MarR family transcriptional regulator